MSVLLISGSEAPETIGTKVEPFTTDWLIELYNNPQTLRSLLSKHRLVICDPGADFLQPLSKEDGENLFKAIRGPDSETDPVFEELSVEGDDWLVFSNRSLAAQDPVLLHHALWKRVARRIRWHMISNGGVLILRCPFLQATTQANNKSIRILFDGLVPGIVTDPPHGPDPDLEQLKGRFRHEHQALAKIVAESTRPTPPHSFSIIPPWVDGPRKGILPQTFEEISVLTPSVGDREFMKERELTTVHGSCVFQRQEDGTPCAVAHRLNDLCILIANEFDIPSVIKGYRPSPELLIFYEGDSIPKKLARQLSPGKPFAVKIGDWEGCLGPKVGAKLLAFAIMKKKRDLGLSKTAAWLVSSHGQEEGLRIFAGNTDARKQIHNILLQLQDVAKVGGRVVKDIGPEGLFRAKDDVYSLNLDANSIVFPVSPELLIGPDLKRTMEEAKVSSQYGLPEEGENFYEQLLTALREIYRGIQ